MKFFLRKQKENRAQYFPTFHFKKIIIREYKEEPITSDAPALLPAGLNSALPRPADATRFTYAMAHLREWGRALISSYAGDKTWSALKPYLLSLDPRGNQLTATATLFGQHQGDHWTLEEACGPVFGRFDPPMAKGEQVRWFLNGLGSAAKAHVSAVNLKGTFPEAYAVLLTKASLAFSGTSVAAVELDAIQMRDQYPWMSFAGANAVKIQFCDAATRLLKLLLHVAVHNAFTSNTTESLMTTMSAVQGDPRGQEDCWSLRQPGSLPDLHDQPRQAEPAGPNQILLGGKGVPYPDGGHLGKT